MNPRVMRVRVNGKVYIRVLGYETLPDWLNEKFPGQKITVSTSYHPGHWSKPYTVYTTKKEDSC